MNCSIDALCQRHIQYFSESFHLAVEHRLFHECDGKPPAQLQVQLEALVPESPRPFESVVSTSSDVHVETKVANKTSKQQPQQSAVADARCKFEQVLQASRQAAAAAATTGSSVHAHGDEKLSAADDAVVAARCRNHEDELMPSLLYCQLVCMLFALGIFCVDSIVYLSYDVQ